MQEQNEGNKWQLMSLLTWSGWRNVISSDYCHLSQIPYTGQITVCQNEGRHTLLKANLHWFVLLQKGNVLFTYLYPSHTSFVFKFVLSCTNLAYFEWLGTCGNLD